MKQLFRLLLLVFSVVALNVFVSSCSEDDEYEAVELSYYTIDEDQRGNFVMKINERESICFRVNFSAWKTASSTIKRNGDRVDYEMFFLEDISNKLVIREGLDNESIRGEVKVSLSQSPSGIVRMKVTETPTEKYIPKGVYYSEK